MVSPVVLVGTEYDSPFAVVVAFDIEFTGDAFRIETPDGKNRMTEIAGYWDDPEFDYRGGLGNLAWNMTSTWTTQFMYSA